MEVLTSVEDLHQSDAVPVQHPSFYFDADPDPTRHFHADLDLTLKTAATGLEPIHGSILRLHSC
jgi:hypothetical protein